MVDEYEVEIIKDGIRSYYSVQVESSNITIVRIPGAYNLNVRAISVCGSKSEPLHITGL